MSTNLPAVRQPQELAVPEEEMQRLLQQAEMYVRSGLLPACIDTPQKALAVALRGRELGLPMQAALQNIYPIQGRTMLSARLTLALLKRYGYRVVPLQVSPELARFRFVSPHGEQFEYEVTWEQAQESRWNAQWDKVEKKWVEKPAWRGSGGRRIMLANRCITQGANMFASDALLGLAANPEDESLAVWDPEDEEFVSEEQEAHREARRERDTAPIASAPRPRGGLLKADARPARWTEPEAPAAEEASDEGPNEPPEPAPAGPGAEDAARWTRSPRERAAFAKFLADHGLAEAEAKGIVAEYLGIDGSVALFSDCGLTRERLQHVMLTWLLHNRPADGEGHWIDDRDLRARFWAIMGQEGYDEQAVHEIVPSLHAWPGSVAEAVDYIVHSEREDRTWLAWPAPEGQEPLL